MVEPLPLLGFGAPPRPYKNPGQSFPRAPFKKFHIRRPIANRRLSRAVISSSRSSSFTVTLTYTMAYVIAVGFFVLAALAHLLFDPWVDNRFLLSLVAVVFTALYGGRWPALLVVGLSVSADYLLNGLIGVARPSFNAVSLALYVVPGLIAIVMIDRLTEAKRRRHGKFSATSEQRQPPEIEAQYRRQTERTATLNVELQRRIEEAQTLIEANPIPTYWTFDPQGGVVRCNRAYRQLLGATEKGSGAMRASGTLLGSRIYRDEYELASEQLPLGRCLRTGVAIAGEELEVVRADGERFFVVASAVPLCSGDRICGAVGVMADVTRRKNAELERAQAERRKDEFLAMLAHELRNPLAPIRNALEIVQQDPRDERRLPWALKLIERQLHQLTRITDDLLELARIVRGQVVLKEESADLRAVIARAIETSRPYIEARRHALHLDLPEEATWINGDIARLAQAISNLLNNAARYTPEGGTVFVSSRPTGAMVELHVRDTGRGIEPALLPRIFESLAQGEQSFARVDGGLGIGLTIAKRIAELHKGTLTANSAGCNKGAEFIITLPLAERVAPHKERLPNVPGTHARRRVFIVDDNQDVADSVAVLLKLRGHVTEQYYVGEGAVEKAEVFAPNVVILDLGLPGLDGYGLARLFRAHARLRSCFLIAMSGYGQAADLQKSAAAGFDCHLLKPVDPPVLFDLVGSMSARRHGYLRGPIASSKETQGRSPAAG